MRVGVPKESRPGERRVALVPAAAALCERFGASLVVERGAGLEAGFPDAAYTEKGVRLADRDELFATADVVCQVNCLGANPGAGRADLPRLRPGQVLVGLCDPLADAAPSEALAERGVSVLALELVPRITRAQSMDVLSSQATCAGYKAVVLAAERCDKLFPMLMTAAGTITAARVLVIGAGVAGLQAIATSRRLGAIVQAYDVRPAVREQVESLGASFLDIADQIGLDRAAGTGSAEDKGGYAKALDDRVYRAQQQAMARAVAESDVVITTAAVPGKRSPVLVTEEMVAAMRPGSVIVDLAAERGGNCAVTRADETVVRDGVVVLGPTNLPASAAHDASQMFARNVAAFLQHLAPPRGTSGATAPTEGGLRLDASDEITEATLLVHDGRIVQRRVREILGLPPIDAPAPPAVPPNA